MRVLVTGANGFLGQAICSELALRSIEVIAVESERSRISENQSDREKFYVDITDRSSVSKLEEIGEADAVIHVAGLAHQFSDLSKDIFYRVNVDGTQNIAEIAQKLGVKHFVQISSVAVYGSSQSEDEIFVDETAELDPENYYGESKLSGEYVCQEVFENSQVNITILRPTTIVGEGDPGNVFRLIEAIDKRRFLWVGDGRNKKSLVYIKDLTDVVADILENKRDENEIFNVTGEPISMREIVETISKALDRRIFPFKFPAKIARISLDSIHMMTGSLKFGNLAKSVEKWVSSDVFSGEAIYRSYGLKPKTPIKKAVEREVNWFLKQK